MNRRQEQEWAPSDEEASFLRESLDERAKNIIREQADLVRKRKELDESRFLIEEEVRRMAEIGRKVQADSNQVIEETRILKQMSLKGNQYHPQQQFHQNNLKDHDIKENNPLNSPAFSSSASTTNTPRNSSSKISINGINNTSSYDDDEDVDWPILDEPMILLFDKHAMVLTRVYEYYRSLNDSGILVLSDIIKLVQDYDIHPTFIKSKEINQLYKQVIYHKHKNSSNSSDNLSYENFVELLAKIAVFSLSKNLFQPYYPTNIQKVEVLLIKWGVASANKLTQIQQVNSTTVN